jgi:hypothetical protein
MFGLIHWAFKDRVSRVGRNVLVYGLLNYESFAMNDFACTYGRTGLGLIGGKRCVLREDLE